MTYKRASNRLQTENCEENRLRKNNLYTLCTPKIVTSLEVAMCRLLSHSYKASLRLCVSSSSNMRSMFHVQRRKNTVEVITGVGLCEYESGVKCNA